MAADEFQTSEDDTRDERYSDRGFGAAHEMWLQSTDGRTVLSQTELFVFVWTAWARQSLIDTSR